ncbi:hypothetical protein N9M66_01800 [Litoreibacter sp.]|nr:hypothetical protein [Litoreibacter sp.]
MPKHPKLCLLHVGKTGGSYVRSILRHNRAGWSRQIQLLRHSATLQNTLESFGEDRQLAFTFRNPTTRFVSAFYSRQRQGRPTYQFQWSAEEAAAFLWFETAEELALALTSKNQARRSAALFTFDAIEHLKANFSVILGSAKGLHLSERAIVACVDLQDLDAKLPDFLARLGLDNFKMPDAPKFHASPTPLPTLSPEAEAALRDHWSEEYKLYATARTIAAGLGLSG